ncbi:MarR family winged helix-turn-helix transcriptional regulator [Allostreptomyces psammosilenae]|uniref:DNA-binding MarR family transcriptional regulator n=1 Tax=Allostreptomyces psammosilenae TaxID=1892865 RepID=A0A852ZUS4_9ACTN|nr:MarR family winged helix-turn-helix transcriptional regulator [Allostreptomyces psammosilenae]NYI05337.1 DNA-binding MarR family transcriptional regulator [Allostreptomyces psammosilenae]
MATQGTGSPTDRLGLLLARHGTAAESRIRAALAATGLKPRQAMALTFLADGPVTQRALTEQLECDPSVLVAILNDLEDHALVHRRRDPGDRRRHIVEITPEGLAALRSTDAAVAEVERQLFADLSDDERTTLRALLSRVRTPGDHDACAGD